MKDKFEFYIAFYERLALQGFQAYVDFSKEHMALICVDGYNIAYFTKADSIEPNPYAEGVEAGTIEKIRGILKTTALKIGICTEKPYDETKHEQLPDGSCKLAEYGGTVLACGQHHLFGYAFSTFRQPTENGLSDERETFLLKAPPRGILPSRADS